MPQASYSPTGQFLGIKRTFLAIYSDLNALTAGQKLAVWAAFTAGNPPLWSQSEGQDSGAVAALSVQAIDVAVSTAFPAATQRLAQMKMVAAYVRDNPTWLVNPAFDATINIPGFTA